MKQERKECPKCKGKGFIMRDIPEPKKIVVKKSKPKKIKIIKYCLAVGMNRERPECIEKKCYFWNEEEKKCMPG